MEERQKKFETTLTEHRVYPEELDIGGITEIAINACREHQHLKKISISSEVESIGMKAFRNCSKLSKIEFHEGLQTIGAWAFENCTSLREVSLPDSVRYIIA